MTSDETPDITILPMGTKGSRTLKEYCTCTFTTHAGLLEPLAVSHVAPAGSVPGQVVVTLILDWVMPGGAMALTKLVTFALLASQLKDE